ncbi:MAG: threonine--tRNA ligase, partial [Proteobacteria bacterium]
FELPRALIPADLERIEARMRDLLKNPQSFIYQELSREEALHLFAEQPYKMDWLQDLQQNVISIYRHRDFADLCRGPHLESSASIEEGSFKLLKIAGAYWKGDEKRPMLQRIYGTVWPSKAQLEAYLYQQEEASRRDHRKLGKELELFFFHETAPGMPYWMPKGLIILNQLINWWREVHDREDYQEISSPLINSKKLWEISGHWEHYREDMFVMNLGEDEVYGVKPMNCPNAMIMFKQKLHSYRDLPLRLSDCDALHRHERSGALHGLLRVQKFQQDDAHIFVAEEGIEAEFDGILNLVEEFYSVFGLSYRFRLATRPKDSIGNDELWEQAEGALKDVLHRKVGEAYELAEGDGAFYGPKIDILIKDALGRDWQMGTLQLDYQLPRRFECQYIDASGKKRYPVVIHRVIYGSLERFIGILIEHSAGLLPLWLAPVQV